MHYDVTIGIPVFQVENYIGRTMESVLSQTYLNIEFLIIDDGSADNSSELVRSYMVNHPRGKDIRLLIHESNRGVSETRNHIIDEARGDYLYFVDSDDIISEDAISLLMNQIKKHHADVAFGSYERIELSGEKSLFSYPTSLFEGNDAFANFVYKKYAGFQASACNYIMSLDLIRMYHLRFYKADFWEDMVFTLDLATKAQRVVLIPDVTYTYLCRENSLSNSWNQNRIEKSKIVEYFNAVNSLKIGSHDLKNKTYYPNRCYFAVLSSLYIICNVLKKWNYIYPSFMYGELKNNLRFHVSFFEILQFKQKRIQSLALWVLGVLPSSICMFFIRFFAKMRGY
jgi:glycosyltransferase involved in cell wall biosynthesis